MNRSIQVAELTAAGACDAQIEELLRYDAHTFVDAGIDDEPLPLPSRQLAPLLADEGAEPIGQRTDPIG